MKKIYEIRIILFWHTNFYQIPFYPESPGFFSTCAIWKNWDPESILPVGVHRERIFYGNTFSDGKRARRGFAGRIVAAIAHGLGKSLKMTSLQKFYLTHSSPGGSSRSISPYGNEKCLRVRQPEHTTKVPGHPCVLGSGKTLFPSYWHDRADRAFFSLPDRKMGRWCGTKTCSAFVFAHYPPPRRPGNI